jgi:biotin transporter BioY
MNGKRTTAEMMGEFVREMAVLVAVFWPLEMEFNRVPFTSQNISVIMLVVSLLLILGIVIERLRP